MAEGAALSDGETVGATVGSAVALTEGVGAGTDVGIGTVAPPPPESLDGLGLDALAPEFSVVPEGNIMFGTPTWPCIAAGRS